MNRRLDRKFTKAVKKKKKRKVDLLREHYILVNSLDSQVTLFNKSGETIHKYKST